MNPNQPDDPGVKQPGVDPATAKPWWLSLTANSQVARVLVIILGLFGVATNEGAVGTLIAAITGIAYAVTEALTTYGRWRAQTSIEFRWPWAKPKT